MVAICTLTTALSCRGRVDGGDSPGRARAALAHEPHGRVELARAGRSDWAALTDDTPLYDKDRLRTGRGAWTQLDFPGGSSLKLEEDSLVTLGSGLLIQHGSVDGELQPGFKLRTPTLEAESAGARNVQFQ